MINEIRKMRLLEEKRGIKLPIPNFFFVERFGRSAQEQMDGLLNEVGKKEWFLFKTDIKNREEGLIGSFLIELEKYAKLGKAYDECVLIEFTEEMYGKDEIEEFVAYLKSLEDKIYFVFTTKQTKNTAFIQKCMEQYFFIRLMEAKEYTITEQMEEIIIICSKYRYELKEEAQDYIRIQLEKREWKDDEQVLCRLRNVVCNFVYEQALENESDKMAMQEKSRCPDLWTINLRMAKKMMAKMENENRKRAIIGFSQGGLQYE